MADGTGYVASIPAGIGAALPEEWITWQVTDAAGEALLGGTFRVDPALPDAADATDLAASTPAADLISSAIDLVHAQAHQRVIDICTHLLRGASTGATAAAAHRLAAYTYADMAAQLANRPRVDDGAVWAAKLARWHARASLSAAGVV